MHDLDHEGWETVAAAGTRRIIASASATNSLVDLSWNQHKLPTHFLSEAPEDRIRLDTGVGERSPLPDSGEPVTLIWLREQDGYHYRFHSTVTNIVQHHDAHPAVEVRMPKDMERWQRRQAFRVPVNLEDAQNLTIMPIQEGCSTRYPAFAHDLSATGARISFALPLGGHEIVQKGHMIEAHISMDGTSYGVTARVVRMEKVGTTTDHEMGRERWMLGIRFLEPYLVFQKKLESYLNRQQRAALRR